jgi:hypothetical protein
VSSLGDSPCSLTRAVCNPGGTSRPGRMLPPGLAQPRLPPRPPQSLARPGSPRRHGGGAASRNRPAGAAARARLAAPRPVRLGPRDLPLELAMVSSSTSSSGGDPAAAILDQLAAHAGQLTRHDTGLTGLSARLDAVAALAASLDARLTAITAAGGGDQDGGYTHCARACGSGLAVSSPASAKTTSSPSTSRPGRFSG